MRILVNKKNECIFALVAVFLFFVSFVSLAQVSEEPLHIPGTMEGTGTHFEIKDSKYLNVSLDSSEDLSARIESMPEMVLLEIDASTGASFANIKLSGFSPNTTYHKYEDDYHNYALLTADEDGAFSFKQDLSRDHIIFIQPRKSTKFIRDDIIGGDCMSIGSWNIFSKTCTLNQDVNETIQIDSDKITLNGDGHALIGSNTGNGIYVYRKNNVRIQDITVTGFYNGIYLYYSGNSRIFSTNTQNNNFGIYLSNSNYTVLQNNIIANNSADGLRLSYSANNVLKDNTVGPGNTTGISGSGNGNTYENNLITGNQFGWFGSGNDVVLRNNKIDSSGLDGFNFIGERCFLRGNSMSGNGRANFRLASSNMSANDVDTSNTVEGKPIYYISGAVGKTYGSSLNMGAFYCYNCENITLSGHNLARGRSQIYLWNTNNSTIENITSPDGDIEVKLFNSSGNIIKESNFGGIILVSGSNNNKIYNNNIGADFFPVTIDSSVRNLFNLDTPIGGNYWKNFTDTCINKNGDNFCDRPFSFGKMTDYLPLANPFDWKLYEKLPVILVPGIGASLNPDLMFGSLLNDNWTLLSHTYDGVIDAFKSMGYEEGKDFFIAYYDWRNKNEDSARDYLEPLIKKALSLNNASKVNIIAHSMGGLVARSYIQGDDYDGDVDNLFLIGTPNKGSSDVYPVWEGGRIPKNWDRDSRFGFKIYLGYLDAKKITFNNYETVHRYIPSVKQLMPVYNYIYPKGSPQDIKSHSAMNEVNNWLDNLNTDIEKLNDRVKVSVISGNDQKTVNNIPVINTYENPLWTDGKPDPLDPERNDSAGDNRVLLSSSQIQSLHSDIISGTHGDIVSLSEQLIAGRINNQLNIIHPAPDIPSEMGFWFASPVDIEIKDPQGRIISGSVNEIPLAKYVSESKPDGFKLASIPNPISGSYEIKLTGNGSGEFHMGSEYMDYKDGNNDVSYLLEGIINSGDVKTYVLKYDLENPENAVTPAFPENMIGLLKYIEDQKSFGTLSPREADFILVKLKVIGYLIDRIYNKDEKEKVIENYKEQVNRQIDWVTDYILNKSGKKAKGEIREDIAKTTVESLKFIKF